jgi:Right handed beta helix region
MNTTRALWAVLAVAAAMGVGCKNSKYCDNSTNPCPSLMTCDPTTHACVSKDGGMGGTGGTGGKTDGGGGDGRADVPPACTASSCTGHTPICGSTSKACELCSSGTECAARDGGGSACNVDAGTCVECVAKSDCHTTAKPVCDTSVNACVGCLVSKTDCAGLTPICDTQACRACKIDADCVTALGSDPGICMPDGHCAAPSEVVYAVQPTSSSCSAANGLLATPYCTAQAAVDKASTGAASIVVLRGSFGNISESATSGQVTVVGQNSATIDPIAGDGIDISGTANLYVRNLTITGGTSTSGVAAHVGGANATLTLLNVRINGNAGAGVVAESGASIVMDRCVVTGSGGLAPADLKTTASPFKITNCVFASSSSGATLDSAVPTGKTGIFKNNTLVGNGTALQCSGSFASGLILYNNTNDVSPGCTPSPCCTGNPMLTSDYHLMSGSLCIDVLTPDTDVLDDIDGQVRPYNLKSDCGADEYEP